MLSQDEVDAFWSGMDVADINEFVNVYGGREEHKRFLCAIDRLGPQGGVLDAYALAFGGTKQEARIRSYDLYHHDSIQALLDRLHSREKEVVWIRLHNLQLQLVERLMVKASKDDATPEEVRLAQKSLNDLRKDIDKQAALERAERTKRGFELGRSKAQDIKAMTPGQIRMGLQAMREILGPERFASLVSEISAQTVPGQEPL